MSAPFRRIVPSVGVTSRMMQFATVLFPLPDSPTRPSELAAPDRERDVVDRMHDALRAEAAHRESA